jgi:hypothetical protein
LKNCRLDFAPLLLKESIKVAENERLCGFTIGTKYREFGMVVFQ